MATIVTINSTDIIANSRADLNTNFANLNSDKIETSYLDTDTTLAANSDVKIPSQKAIKTYIDTGGNPSSLTGIVAPYAGSSAPSGWLLCNGAAVSRSTYANLFAITSTTYGVGDGSTTFNLPDLRNRMAFGVGTSTKVATFASRSGDVITVTGLSNASNNEFQTGKAVTYHTSSGTITGLSNDTVYYIVRTGNLTFSLASSLANAIAGTAISLSSDGSGVQTFTLTFTTRTLGDTGGEENHGLTVSEIPSHSHIGTGDDAATGSTKRFEISNRAANFTTAADSLSNTGGSTAHSILNPFVALNYIIKT